MFRGLIVAVGALAAMLPAPAAAQAEAEAGITAFSQGRFKGFRTLIGGPSQFRRPLVVRSLVVPPGVEWELCSGLTYTGCRQVKGSMPSMVMTVRSARPVAAMLSASAGLRAGVPSSGQSLRGMASEYFVAPGEGGSRVEVLPGTAEAMSRRAGDYCRARGWRSSPHARLQKVEGRAYLADVLCADD